MNVKLIKATPLWIVANAIRTAWNSHHLSDTTDEMKKENKIGEKDKKLIKRVGVKNKHLSVLAHGIVQIEIKNVNNNIKKFFLENAFSKVVLKNDDLYSKDILVSTNLRVIYENRFLLRDVIYDIMHEADFGYLFDCEVIEWADNYRIYEFGILEKYKKTNKNDSYKLPLKMKPFINKYGYYEFILIDNFGKKKHKTLHRLIAKHFMENTYEKCCVNHIDGNKLNCSINNLEWVTYSENEQHSYKVLGKQVWNKGIKTGFTKCYKGSKKVAQYDLDGNLIKIWNCPGEAQYFGGYSIKSISSVCKKTSKTHKGYIWKYIEGDESEQC